MYSNTASNKNNSDAGSVTPPDWITSFKNRAHNRFNLMSWPSTQVEEYRRTDLSAVDFNRYQQIHHEVPATDVHHSEIADYELLIQLSPFDTRVTYRDTPDTSPVKVCSVHAIEDTYEHHITGLLNKRLEEADNRFEVWNYSTIHNGTVIIVPEKTHLKKPIVIHCTADNYAQLVAPNVTILLEKESSAECILIYHSNDRQDLFVNSVVNVIGEAGSNGKIVTFQNTGAHTTFIDYSYATLKRNAKLERIEVNAGGKCIKTRFTVNLSENGSEAHLKGISLATTNQHLDIGTVQRHTATGTTSRSLYKSAAFSNARTIHQGLIHVSPLAQKTDAYLTSKNLLLSPNARADSIPALQIDTNDVRCSHGATTGPVDKNQLFYLTSRGLSEEVARQLLVEAYFDEIIKDIPKELSSHISSTLLKIQAE